MHLVILSQYYEPEVGAAQSRLSALARGVSNAGHRVTVVTAQPNYPTGKIADGYPSFMATRESIDGVRVIRVPLYPATGRGFQRALNYLTFSLSSLVGLVMAGRPTHLFVESPPLTLAVPGVHWARLRGASIIFNVADPWPDVAAELGVLNPGRLLDAAYALEAWAYEEADLVTAPTEGVLDRLRTHKGVPESKLLLLPNGADTDRFDPDRADSAELAALGLQADGLLVYAGTMGYLHGLENVIDAAGLARDSGVSVALIGGGSQKDELMARARESGGDNVTFIDPITPDRLAKLLPFAAAGIVSLADIPSNDVVRSAKMFPVMASGRPVLHIGLGEGADLVSTAGAGMVVPNRDPAEIAAAMSEVVTASGRGDELGESGRRYVEDHLSWRSIVAKLLDRLGEGNPDSTPGGGGGRRRGAMNIQDRDELSETYAGYGNEEVKSRWSQQNPGNRFILEERTRTWSDEMSAAGVPLRPLEILDIGCGGSTSLPEGIKASRRTGIDLLLERCVVASAQPEINGAACADGAQLPFAERTFDLALLFTVLSSIPDASVRAGVCAEAARILRPGGAMVIYDMRLPNPANRAISPISDRAVRGWLPGLDVHSQSLTLVPQLARRIGDRPDLYRRLAAAPTLRSHRMWVATKPA
ncbi:MAG: glycosyltransferase [Microthrixaceae bacterium]